MKKIRYYTVETENQVVLNTCNNKVLAIVKCIFNKDAKYVFGFEYEVDAFEDADLMGCVFSKK